MAAPSSSVMPNQLVSYCRTVTDRNPFIFTRPVDPEDLINREPEAQQLLDLAEGTRNTPLRAEAIWQDEPASPGGAGR